MRSRSLLLLLWLLPATLVSAGELSGRFSMLGTTARAQAGEVGYREEAARTLSADQQSLRLMLDGLQRRGEWALHLKGRRLAQSGDTGDVAGPETLFRYRALSGEWLDETGAERRQRVGYELDRLLYRHRFSHATLGFGRQPIDWGSGRLWQPFNIFGAFAPTDLDTDYKPGIDALTLEGYPSPFSTLSAAYVWSDAQQTDRAGGGALHYRRQVGTLSEFSLLAGRVLDNTLAGAAYESAWGGMGWRLEGVHYRLGDKGLLFAIAGVDYRFGDGTLVVAEWHHNSRGATSEEALPMVTTEPLFREGLLPYTVQDVLGVTLERDLTPLWQAGYTVLLSRLETGQGGGASSLLHQLRLRYSVSDESDLLLSLSGGSGAGLADTGQPRSAFGHYPDAFSLRLRFYFRG
ncbi:MAG: hypothetical protein ACQETD_08150 [Pseudomonadota bacterium]